jgi:hypothetical protein
MRDKYATVIIVVFVMKKRFVFFGVSFCSVWYVSSVFMIEL